MQMIEIFLCERLKELIDKVDINAVLKAKFINSIFENNFNISLKIEILMQFQI